MRCLPIVLCILFFFNACSSSSSSDQTSTNSSKHLALFNNLQFNLNEGEKPSQIAEEINETYASFFNGQTFKAPLYRYIKHDEYDIFIGLPYQQTIKKAISYLPSDKENQLQFLTDSASFVYQQYQLDSTFLTSWYYQVNKSSFFLITTCKEQNITTSKFGLEDLTKRISTISK